MYHDQTFLIYFSLIFIAGYLSTLRIFELGVKMCSSPAMSKQSDGYKMAAACPSLLSMRHLRSYYMYSGIAPYATWTDWK
jgi:hypothetical protein